MLLMAVKGWVPHLTANPPVFGGLTLYIEDHVLEHLAVDPSLRIDAPGLTWHPGLGPQHSLRALPGWPDDLQAHVGGHLQGAVVASSAHSSPSPLPSVKAWSSEGFPCQCSWCWSGTWKTSW